MATQQQQRTIYIADDRETIGGSNLIVQGGSYLKVFGNNNVIEATSSEVRGDGNVVSASGAKVWGNGNSVTGTYARVEGDNNAVNGSGAKVGGHSNTVTGTYVKVAGSHNAVSGSGAKVVGHSNRVSGSYAKVQGNNNAVEGGSVKVNGSNNNVNGNYASVRGSNNVVSGDNVSATGNNNRVTGEWARVGGGANNTVNGLGPEVVRQQQQQRLNQQIQSYLQEAQNIRLSPIRVMNQPLQSTTHNRRGGQLQQQIQLNLRGHDERSDENGDVCMICLDNRAVVASFCCGKQTVCVGCARSLYQGKLVGSEACMNCRGTVSNVARIS